MNVQKYGNSPDLRSSKFSVNWPSIGLKSNDEFHNVGNSEINERVNI